MSALSLLFSLAAVCWVAAVVGAAAEESVPENALAHDLQGFGHSLLQLKSCEDMYFSCRRWARLGACESRRFTHLQKKTYCRRSCRLCKTKSEIKEKKQRKKAKKQRKEEKKQQKKDQEAGGGGGSNPQPQPGGGGGVAPPVPPPGPPAAAKTPLDTFIDGLKALKDTLDQQPDA
ncbi:hypothetical protein M3Y99_01704200 [Aphelenchoides fujianensis]|nr:hypothetical protein M3Y99_01704200 [Aphelenchoides fujianensis]